MRRILWVGGAALVVGSAIWVALKLPTWLGSSAQAEQVILMHGLGRTESAMLLLENHLARAGYEVHNVGYPSLSESPELLIDRVAKEIEQCCMDSERPVHFVAHSLGGLITRAYLDTRPLPNLGSVVLIGTPNQGSEIVDRFGDLWLFQALVGPTGRQLGTEAGDLPSRIGPPYYPLGIIAGVRNNPLAKQLQPEASDGIVSVESARLEGVTDFIVMETGHTMMRYDPRVAEQVIHFLQHQQFFRPDGSGE